MKHYELRHQRKSAQITRVNEALRQIGSILLAYFIFLTFL